MMSHPRFLSSYLTIIVLALGACHSATTVLGDAASASDDPDDEGSSIDDIARRRPPVDARVADARPSDASASDASPNSDAGGQPGGDGGSTGAPGVVSCYLEAYPASSCTLPTHCCFSNYSSAHNGECSSSSCTWGTIECDGPEDCASGQYCCAHATMDPEYGLTGYKLSCQATACGAAPVNQELCHPTSSLSGTCSGGRTCVPALGNDNDLPRSLSICK